MAELMARASSKFAPLQKGQTVEGTVVKLTPSEILLDIGAKGYALVIEYDKANLENLLANLTIGERVSASVISPESEEGFPVVSLRRALDNIVFSKLEQAYKADEVINAHIAEATRGGYFAETQNHIRGFLPHSQILPDSEASITGKSINVKIIELDRAKKRVIFSQKATVFVTDPKQIESYVKKGETIKGEVHAVTPYGIYITLKPKEGVLVEGFVHISEISYERVENVGELYKVGDKIEAQVLEVDRENRRVNLSIKSLKKDQFEELIKNYKKEQKVSGMVSSIKGRGVTISLGEVNGFIPANKVPTGTEYARGQTIEAEIADFDTKRRVIILTPILKKTFVGYR